MTTSFLRKKKYDSVIVHDGKNRSKFISLFLKYEKKTICVTDLINTQIDIIKKAQIYLNDSIKKYSFGKQIYKIKSNSEFETKLISTLRGQLSKENYKILHIDKSKVTLEFVNSQNMKKVSASKLSESLNNVANNLNNNVF